MCNVTFCLLPFFKLCIYYYISSVKCIESGILGKEKLRGTLGYMSPELILCGYNCKATDVFAAGVVMWILLNGMLDFDFDFDNAYRVIAL